MTKRRTAVVALGGNALSPDGKSDIHAEFANTRKSMAAIFAFIDMGYDLVITHGNGPQVGNALLRVEMSRSKAPDVPLGVLVADTQGSIGYMIEQSLQNELKKRNITRSVITLVTQVMIDINDPACTNPTKFVGQFFSEEEIHDLADKNNWSVKEVKGKGWRRVVPSPHPVSILNSQAVKTLVDEGNIVIAGGGGGIPVYVDERGLLEGFDAVIDKDLATAVLGNEIEAEELFILTGVDKVYLNFGTDNEKALDTLTLSEAEQLLKDGQFPAGSMGPKIEGALHFLKNGGKSVCITSLETIEAALNGKSGTTIVM